MKSIFCSNVELFFEQNGEIVRHRNRFPIFFTILWLWLRRDTTFRKKRFTWHAVFYTFLFFFFFFRCAHIIKSHNFVTNLIISCSMQCYDVRNIRWKSTERTEYKWKWGNIKLIWSKHQHTKPNHSILYGNSSLRGMERYEGV